METLDKGMLQSWREQDGVRFHHTIQNDVQFKTYELFISGTFYVIFWGPGWPQLTETAGSETAGEGGSCTHFRTSPFSTAHPHRLCVDLMAKLYSHCQLASCVVPNQSTRPISCGILDPLFR